MKKVLITISVLLLTACSLYKELPSDNEGINNNNKNVLSSENALEVVKEKYKLFEESYTNLTTSYESIYKDNKRYYLVTNYDTYKNIYTEEALEEYNKDNNIILEGEKYYSSNIPRLKYDYDEIAYTEISITENKMKYNVLMYKCTKTETKNNETVCKNSSLETNSFELVKKDDNWLISVYEMK